MGDIKSKVPGIVDEIKVSVGDVVQKGQPLIVLEAMKMKMPLPAPCAGTIKNIAVQTGDRVNPGKLLIEIEE